MSKMNPWFKAGLAGVGILSDAFNLFSINLVKNVMNSLYPQSKAQTSAISTAALVGAVFGQIVFGALADRLGRRVIFISTITLVIVGSLGAATSTESSSVSVYTQLCIWLAILGFGVGGEYPLSATVSSEGSADASRGKAVSSVFAMQGVGNVLASLVMVILLKTDLPLDTVWRLALALGAAPGLLTVYWRYKMEESSHFVKTQSMRGLPPSDAGAAAVAAIEDEEESAGTNSSVNASRQGERRGLLAATAAGGSPGGKYGRAGVAADGDSSSGESLLDGDAASPSAAAAAPAYLGGGGSGVPPAGRWAFLDPFRRLGATMWQFRWTLLATAGSWCIFDIVFYANGLFSGTVLEEIGFAGDSSSSSSSGNATSTFALADYDAAAAAGVAASATPAVGGAMARYLADSVTLAVTTLFGAGAAAATATTTATTTTTSGLLGAAQSEADLEQLAVGNLILAFIGLPGYVIAILTIDRVGRRNMQLMGFTAIAIVFIIMAAALAPLTDHAKWLLVLLYGLSFFFSNFGPNTTTFVIPAEAFPTAAKATCHGISAASGKIGAAVGAAIMEPLLQWYGTDAAGKQKGLQLVLYICGAVGVAGALWTLALTRESGAIRIADLDAQSHRMHIESTKGTLPGAATPASGTGEDRASSVISMTALPPPPHRATVVDGAAPASR